MFRSSVDKSDSELLIFTPKKSTSIEDPAN